MGQLIPLFNSHLSQFQETNNTSCFLINAQEQPLIGSQLVTCYLRMLIKLRNKPLRYSILCYVAKSSSCKSCGQYDRYISTKSSNIWLRLWLIYLSPNTRKIANKLDMVSTSYDSSSCRMLPKCVTSAFGFGPLNVWGLTGWSL